MIIISHDTHDVIMTDYTVDDILAELDVYKTTNCFKHATIPKESKFWNIRREIGSDTLKDTYGVQITKDDKMGWIAKVRIGTCDVKRTKFEHDIKERDCVLIHDLHPKATSPLALGGRGLVSEVLDDGRIKAYNLRLGVYEDYLIRENTFIPLYEDGDITKNVKTIPLDVNPSAEYTYKKSLEGWFNESPRRDVCFEVSYKNRNEK